MSKRPHGNGSIDKRGKNSFRLRYRIDGEPFTKTFRGTFDEAKKELRRLLRSGDTGEHVAPDSQTVAAWAEHWIAIGAPGRRRKAVGARALERYEELLRTHVLPTLGETKLQKLKSTAIDKLYLALESKMAPRTAKHVHSVFNACLGAAVRTGKLSISPMQSVEKVPFAGESDVGIALEEEQLRKLVLGFKGTALFPVVSVAAFTGARRNEILALRWSDLDPEKKTLRIERALEETDAHGIRFKGPKKDSHKRTITIDDDLLAMLLAERDKHLRIVAGISAGAPVDLSLIKLPKDALMFPNLGADLSFVAPRRPRDFTKAFATRAKRLGFPIRFHDLRGTHETLLLDAGVPLKAVAERCGHDPVTLLRNYAKRTRKADTTAASVIGNISKGILG
jgi:integrase